MASGARILGFMATQSSPQMWTFLKGPCAWMKQVYPTRGPFSWDIGESS